MENFIPKTNLGKLAVKIGIVLAISGVLTVIFAIAIGGNPDVIENNFLLKILAGIPSILFTLSGPLIFYYRNCCHS
jgi:hypothetical protein